MTTKQKKIIFGIIFLLAAIGLAYALYWAFFAPPPKERVAEKPQTQQEAVEKAEFPEAQQQERAEQPPEDEEEEQEAAPTPEDQITPEEGRVTQPVTDNVDHLDLGQGDQARFYNEEDGKFYRLVDGELKPLDDKVFFNVDNTSWAPEENKAILEYPDGANIYYNFDTKQQETLPKHWKDFSFSETGEEIATKNMSFSPENRWLIESDPDGSSVERITHLGENANRVDVNWSPNGDVVGVSKTGPGQGAYQQEVYLLGENNENFKSLSIPGRGVRSKWSPSGEKLLYSAYSNRSNFQPELWIVNAEPGNIGRNRKKLNVRTWADKCGFENDKFVYCGVPTNLPQGAGFEPEIANDIEDNIYKINTNTGAKTQISTGDQTFTVDSLRVKKETNQLIITAKNKPGLFKIDI
ncbi:MAG: TolB family protein [Candidatus Magasanikbacteria bacterium]